MVAPPSGPVDRDLSLGYFGQFRSEDPPTDRGSIDNRKTEGLEIQVHRSAGLPVPDESHPNQRARRKDVL
jgi:hypothetical protein